MSWVKIASLFMLAGVMLGAFGAHGLKHRLSSEMMEVYKTAVFYQFVHAGAIFVVAWLLSAGPDPKLDWSAKAFTAGIFLFSGSLYVLALTGQRWLGALAPFGGLCFIFGWLLIAFSRR